MNNFNEWDMISIKPKCYSYVRWSSNKQANGTSLERQKALAKKIAKENGLEYDEVTGPGVSAFRSKNSEFCALSYFIEKVRCCT